MTTGKPSKKINRINNYMAGGGARWNTLSDDNNIYTMEVA